MSADARIVRAGFYMLEEAWRSPIPGTIRSGFSALANIARLPEEMVREHYVELTYGWELQEDGRLHHRLLEEIAQSVTERFGEQLAVLAEGAMVACQGGAGQFELVPSAEVAKKRRGKTAFPKDFALDRSTLESVIAEGYDTPELQSWLVQEVRNYALADDVRQKNWQATVMKFMGSTITRRNFQAKFGYPLGHRPSAELAVSGAVVQLSPRQRLAQASMGAPRSTFAQMTAQSNSDRMADALNRRLPVEEMAPAPGAHP